MFVSFGSSGTVDQDGSLVDGADGTALDPGGVVYRARHAQPEVDTVDEPSDGAADVVEAPLRTGVVETAAVEAGDEWAVDEWDGPEDFRFVVRPYTWTRGRTRPVQDLAVETLVFTSDEGRDLTGICSAEHAAIAELCAEVRSVAEVAALLGLPLGVARVLLADMIDTGLLNVHRNTLGLDSGPDISLMERVLAGLYRL
ncbi:MAG: DUF742 domain-containing protein [Actinomycetota bacterium]|nr:DUF742 domain-containing protein [Actinomycetota bacterium]